MNDVARVRIVGIDGVLAYPFVCLCNISVMVNVINGGALSNQLGITDKARARRDGSICPSVSGCLRRDNGNRTLILDEIDGVLHVVGPAVNHD